jgi:hypothetical protein
VRAASPGGRAAPGCRNTSSGAAAPGGRIALAGFCALCVIVAGAARPLGAEQPIPRERASERRGDGSRSGGRILISGGPDLEVSADAEIRDGGNRLLYACSDTRLDAKVRDMTAADLDGDGREELLLAIGDVAGSSGGVIILEWDGEALREITSFMRRDYLPLRIEAGDADGDGETEVAVLLYDRAKRDPASFAMKFHLFDLKGGRLAPLWFSEREVEDFRIVDWAGAGRLLALERMPAGHALRLFRWENFGFWLEKTVLVSEKPVCLEGDARRVVVREADGNRSVIVQNGLVLSGTGL